MTNPSDPWAQRPDSPDAPTEKIGAPGKPDESLHTSEYTRAYGPDADPTASYQQTEPYSYFDQPPGPNATRELSPHELPPYDSAWGGYENQYGASGYGPPPGGVPPGGPTEQIGPTGLPVEPRRRRTGLWIGLTAAVFVLVVLGGIAVGAFLAGGDDSSSSAAADTTSRSAPTRRPVVPPSGNSGPQSGLPQIPGLGDIDNIGATMGKIGTNDGTTLSVESLLGSVVTVHTDDKTQVIAAGSGKVADLHPGEMIVVQGDKQPDGSIRAKIIISTSLTPPR
ncbi:hypothetical protein BJY24_002993 [Nocardia transvalensis]|uniref:DUF5666 domain-containing protein n=1 Tax=Nocardia transvalensis TaxID=37333 RepID=A0A7W9PDE2_9NOCA|nr:DUF5666 domain-containing protein [Nocardia transvalensis]MBB5914126.1 hypothetical protein [Nocardia transvalensis]